MDEPPEKRAKIPHDIDIVVSRIVSSEQNLTAIVSDEYSNSIPTIKAYAGFVRDHKLFSNTISVLNKSLPLNELQHLKRVHKSCVILCPVSYLNSQSIQEYVEHHLPELKDSFDYFKDIEIPLYPPKTKKQHAECNKQWGCNFHPDRYLERLISNSFFKKDELEIHRQYMGMVFETVKFYMKKDGYDLDMEKLSLNINAAVVVDPSIDSVVAVAYDNRETHPIQHSAMLAIDNVAKTQDGGAWTTDNKTDDEIKGFDKNLLLHLKDKYRSITFRYKKFLTKKEIDDKRKLGENPYICTGYYIYLLREPCVMCAMGLVHARMKRVFFCFDNPHQGALKSVTKLQTNAALNHRFEVFTGFYS